MKHIFIAFLLGVAGFGCGGGSGTGGEEEGQPPNIIIFTLESLRADHVGSYGYHLPVTPNLDRFAEEAIRFTDAHSVTSWTLSAHASLLTGFYPAAHQVLEPGDRLGDSYRTLAEILAGDELDGEDRYATTAFVSGPFLRTAFNLNQGFDHYDDSLASPGEVVSHGDITNPSMESRIVSYLRSVPKRPFFLFAYFWDIHYDYIPPPPFDTLFVPPDAEEFDISRFEFNDSIRPGMSEERLRYIISQYDGEIRCTDEMLGRILQVIRDEGLWENTVIIITSDHGEEFFEHRQKGHKNNLHVESVQVPLLIKPAGRFEPGVDSTLASLVDVVPTILAGRHDRMPAQLPGRALIGAEAPGVPPDVVLFDLALPLQAVVEGKVVASRTDRWLGVRTGHYKYLRLPGRRGERLYSVADDRGERHNISGNHRAICDSLGSRLASLHLEMERFAVNQGEGAKADLTPEDRTRLKALGYIK